MAGSDARHFRLALKNFLHTRYRSEACSQNVTRGRRHDPGRGEHRQRRPAQGAHSERYRHQNRRVNDVDRKTIVGEEPADLAAVIKVLTKYDQQTSAEQHAEYLLPEC